MPLHYRVPLATQFLLCVVLSLQFVCWTSKITEPWKNRTHKVWNSRQFSYRMSYQLSLSALLSQRFSLLRLVPQHSKSSAPHKNQTYNLLKSEQSSEHMSYWIRWLGSNTSFLAFLLVLDLFLKTWELNRQSSELQTSLLTHWAMSPEVLQSHFVELFTFSFEQPTFEFKDLSQDQTDVLKISRVDF